MSKKNLIIAFILVLLSLLWLFVPHTSCEAAETYTITAQELTTLEGIKQSVQSNRELQDGIGNATETVDRLADVLDRSETTVDAAKGTAESLDRNLETAADAITKCQRIIDRIKQRNEERTPEP